MKAQPKSNSSRKKKKKYIRCNCGMIKEKLRWHADWCAWLKARWKGREGEI